MVDKRPFVDRRIGFAVLFHEQNLTVEQRRRLEEETKQNYERLNNLSLFITTIEANTDPGQMRIIFNESSISTSALQRVTDDIKQAINETSVDVRIQTMQVTAYAISPGDKVRNTISF